MSKQRGRMTLFVTVTSRVREPSVETITAEALACFDGLEVAVNREVVRVEGLAPPLKRGSRWLVSVGLTLPTPGTLRRERFDTWLEQARTQPTLFQRSVS